MQPALKVRTVLLCGVHEDARALQKAARDHVRRRHKLLTDPSFKVKRRALLKSWRERNKQQTREYQRAWRRANPDKKQAQEARYRKAHREQMRAYMREYMRKRRAAI